MSAQHGPSTRSLAIALIVVIIALMIVFGMFTSLLPQSSSTASQQCGDYSLVDGRYDHTPGSGEYESQGDGSYVYVGCSSSGGDRSNGGGGGFFIFGNPGDGSRYGSGSGNRGGGSGFGK